jgi:hypothetical protein
MILNYSEYIKESFLTKRTENQFFKTYKETKNWLDEMKIKKYTINDDLTVDVDGSVFIVHFFSDFNKIPFIPIQFNTINGNFDCSHNNLTSLKGCPFKIKKDFNCHNNDLKDINDLNSKILFKSIRFHLKWIDEIKQDVWDKYFLYWYNKDSNIIYVLKDKISDNIKNKYSHIFNANNFDLI